MQCLRRRRPVSTLPCRVRTKNEEAREKATHLSPISIPHQKKMEATPVKQRAKTLLLCCMDCYLFRQKLVRLARQKAELLEQLNEGKLDGITLEELHVEMESNHVLSMSARNTQNEKINQLVVQVSKLLLQQRLSMELTTILLVRLPTPLQRILSIATTNSCAAGREMPRTKNKSKHIHGNLSGERVYGQTARSAHFNQLTLPILKHCTTELVLLSS